MLRLPEFELLSPTTVSEVTALLAEHGEDALLLAGGTDLLPNMKHELFTPRVVISLGAVEGLRRSRVEPDGTLVIGAMTPLDTLAHDEEVRSRAPALAQAAGLVAGPQLRRMGTLGGNVMLDTRCQWYNQSYFWRSALGFCMKKDGTVCHVVEGGSKCVAAASNDTAPPLMTLGAELVFADANGERRVPIADLWLSDGIYNKRSKGELLVSVRIPPQHAGQRGAYGKLRERGSIDFPLFGIAVRFDVEDETIVDAAAAVVSLQARPLALKKFDAAFRGVPTSGSAFEDALATAADLAYKQCRPMANVPGDEDWRREMAPVYLRRTVRAALDGTGPVHHV
ncbi:MAG: FAD binding domain-containing protein [Planctomycetota bacterium]